MDFEEHLELKLGQLFPDDDRRLIAAAEFVRYGIGDHEPESEHVRLAILKLAGSDLERIRSNVRAAKGDFRDVLAWAEYPGRMKANSWRLPEAERGRLAQADLAQYLTWLGQAPQ